MTWEPLITNSSADFSCSSDIAVVNAGQVVYAPSCGPYFLESKDGGTTWTQAQAAPNGVDIKAMVVDPKNDSTIYLSAPGVGVLKSQDGGQTWDALPSSPVITTPSGTAVLHNALCIDQQDTVYYGTDHGLFLTRDGGTTWLQSISGFAVSDVAFRDLAVGPTGVFALAGIESSTVTDLYETTDGGNSWTALATGLDAERVVPDPNNSSTIYLSGLQYHVVYKSTDGGVTFQPSDSGIPFSSSGGGSGYIMLTGPTGTIIPLISSPNTFLVGSLVLGVFKTQDAAQSWESSNTGISAFAGLDVAVDPQTPTTVYLAAANGGGIFKSTDSGVTWVNLVQNSAFAIAVDPFDSDHLLAHVGGEGLAESHDGGSTWQTVTSGLPTPPSGGTPWIVGIRFDPTQKGTIYVSTSGGGVAVLKSTDGGTTYAISNSGLNTGESGWDDSLSPVAIDSVDSAVLFLSTSIGLFKSSDAGASWVLKKPLSSPQSVVTISIDERVTPHAVYAAGFSVFLKSADFGETWQPVPVPSDLSSWLYSVVVDPGWAESVFLISGGYPAQAAAWSPDGGVSWTPLAGGLGQPLLTYNGSGLAIAPSEPEVLFVVSFNNSVLRFVIGP